MPQTETDWFGEIFERSAVPPIKASVIRRGYEEDQEEGGGEQTMSITYHDSVKSARAIAKAIISELLTNPNEIDAGYGHPQDYRVVIGPSVEE
jgi:hypothetical protein